MAALITDPQLEEELIARRQETGADRWDEVWEGVYVMSPDPSNHHQILALRLGAMLLDLVPEEDGVVFAGNNVSDCENWRFNFRCPDVAVYLNSNPAEDRDTFMLGGPDLAIEIVSPHDRTREKFDFYASVNTRELLIIDRDPWKLELYRLNQGTLSLVEQATPEASSIKSLSVPLVWRFVVRNNSPRIQVQSPSGKSWLI